MPARNKKATHLGGQQPHAGLPVHEGKEGGLLPPEVLLDHYAAACRAGTGLLGCATRRPQSDAASHVGNRVPRGQLRGAACRQDVNAAVLRRCCRQQCMHSDRQASITMRGFLLAVHRACAVACREHSFVWCRWPSVRRSEDAGQPSTAADSWLAAVMVKRASRGRLHAASLIRDSRTAAPVRQTSSLHTMQQHRSATTRTAKASTAGQRPDSACAALVDSSQTSAQQASTASAAFLVSPETIMCCCKYLSFLHLRQLRHA